MINEGHGSGQEVVRIQD